MVLRPVALIDLLTGLLLQVDDEGDEDIAVFVRSLVRRRYDTLLDDRIELQLGGQIVQLA